MSEDSPGCFLPAGKGEIFAWAMYDFANSAYSTIVSTAIFNPYFVKVAAGPQSGLNPDAGALMLTISISISSLLVVLSAPIIGTIADAKACKKTLLLISTIICALATAMLSQVGAGAYILGMILLMVSNLSYGTGEDLIAAFLPEIAKKEDMGRVSAFGWSVGYIGGLLVLALCFWYVKSAQAAGLTSEQFVPVTMLITAACFAVASAPTFIFLKERALPEPSLQGRGYLAIGFSRLYETWQRASHYQDLFRFLFSLLLYSCGITTIVVLASVYAQKVMNFTEADSVVMLILVNIMAVVGATISGYILDRVGSVKTLIGSLFFWLIAIVLACVSNNIAVFWFSATMIGVALGASGSSGRALVGQFSPSGRAGEFFGLWGLAVKLSAAVGPLTFGCVTYLTAGNYRLAMLSTALFFVAGLIALATVNEERGKRAAQVDA